MINPINKKDNKHVQYAITVPLDHEEIGKDPEEKQQKLNLLYVDITGKE